MGANDDGLGLSAIGCDVFLGRVRGEVDTERASKSESYVMVCVGAIMLTHFLPRSFQHTSSTSATALGFRAGVHASSSQCLELTHLLGPSLSVSGSCIRVSLQPQSLSSSLLAFSSAIFAQVLRVLEFR